LAIALVLAAAVATLVFLLVRQDVAPAPTAPAQSDAGPRYLAQPAPKPAPSLPDTNAAPSPPTRPDPFGSLFQGFGQILDDPTIQKPLDDLQKSLRQGFGALGKMFKDLLPGPRGGTSPSPSPSPGQDPLSKLLDQAMKAF